MFKMSLEKDSGNPLSWVANGESQGETKEQEAIV